MDNVHAVPRNTVTRIGSDTGSDNHPMSQADQLGLGREEMPLHIYHEQFGRPYVTEKLGLHRMSEELPKEAVERLQAIDKAMFKRMVDNKLNFSLAAYDELMENIQQELGLKEHDSPYLKMIKLYLHLK